MPHAQPLGGVCVVGADNSVLADADALQGLWTQDQYLAITNVCNHLIEFTDGSIEVLPTPTRRHQAISRLLFLALFDLVARRGGEVFYAPLRLRIREGKFREPDLLLVMSTRSTASSVAANAPAACCPPALKSKWAKYSTLGDRGHPPLQSRPIPVSALPLQRTLVRH